MPGNLTYNLNEGKPMKRKLVHLLNTSVFFIILSLSLAQPAFGYNNSKNGNQAIVMTASGPLTPAMLQYLTRGLSYAQNQGAALVIFQLNTPGGEIELLTRMVTAIRGSHVPVVVYVAPRGAMAGSAGTVITLAGHVAAMAPETAIGAASPVGSQGEDIGTTMQTKAKEILKATVRSLAERRNPEAIALAEDTIQNARAVSSAEALKIGLIDFIANDTSDLITQMDGFQVYTVDGALVLSTKDLVQIPFNTSLIEQLLQMLTNPNIVFLLLSVGVQAILIELSSPGGWVAGFIGVVCLALATYGLGILPVNWFGILFLLLSFVLFILDIKAPTHGALTVAGIGSFIVGGLVLFNSPGIPDFQRVSVPLVIGSAVVTGAIFFIIVGFALRARKSPIISGQESLIERIGIVREVLDPNGSVQLGGELWSAESENEVVLPVGTKIKVVGVKGLKLIVREVMPSLDK
jgi:membrane-bound serine protease (ClpP class)